MSKKNLTKASILPESKLRLDELRWQAQIKEGNKIAEHEMLKRLLESEKVRLMALEDAELRRRKKYG